MLIMYVSIIVEVVPAILWYIIMKVHSGGNIILIKKKQQPYFPVSVEAIGIY